MNVLLILAVALGVFLFGIRFYSRHIARLLGSDDKRSTPAVEKNDGRDYVPTRTHVLFAHHFATIAGAGPIIGPVMGFAYGLVPSLIWILIGAVFIGAVHDSTAVFASVREGGRSMAQIAGRTLGKTGVCAVYRVYTGDDHFGDFRVSGRGGDLPDLQVATREIDIAG